MVETDLLWKAFPRGYLLAEGGRTVGGWMCEAIHYGRIDWRRPERPGCQAGQFQMPIDGQGYATIRMDDRRPHPAHTGQLLPYVSPEDPLTWAALLRELARRVRTVGQEIPDNLVWCPLEHAKGQMWWLGYVDTVTTPDGEFSEPRVFLVQNFGPYAAHEDAATALVRALADALDRLLRQAATRSPADRIRFCDLRTEGEFRDAVLQDEDWTIFWHDSSGLTLGEQVLAIWHRTTITRPLFRYDLLANLTSPSDLRHLLRRYDVDPFLVKPAWQAVKLWLEATRYGLQEDVFALGRSR